MKAQVLYDLREQEEFCSGSELHEFFQEQTGDPSPSGSVEIDDKAANEFVEACQEKTCYNSKRGGARPGAGRKPKTPPMLRYIIRLPPEWKADLKAEYGTLQKAIETLVIQHRQGN